jgi:hypothetical protein
MAFRKESGGTGVSRRDECRKILRIIEDDFDRMTTKDANFYTSMHDKLESDAFEPTADQLFWLRDIRDRML